MIRRKLVAPPLEVNSYLIADETTGKAVVVDPGWDPVGIVKMAQGFDVVAIISTHAHLDHFAGAFHLQRAFGCPFYIGERDAAGLSDWHLNMGIYMEDMFRELGLALERDIRLPSVDGVLREGELIEVGSESLLVWETPGHTPGHISLLGKGFALVGDVLTLFSVGRSDFPGGDPEALRSSVERLLGLPPDTLVMPGHGPEATLEQICRENRVIRDFLGL